MLLAVYLGGIKDHMRKAGDVCFSEVFRDRGGESNFSSLK